MDWSETVLERLVKDGATETTELEFKACGALAKTDAAKRELAKDVAAMANAAGGTIIYGMIETNIYGMIETNQVASAIDIGFDEFTISKEFIEQVIGSGIQPRVMGVRVQRVPLPSKGNRVAFVVEIPQAVEHAPHQVLQDKRYPKRLNFTTYWMEDYEIRDVLRRARSPDLHVTWRLPVAIPKWQIRPDSDGLYWSEPFVLELIASNRTSEPALYAIFGVYLDAELRVTSHGEYQSLGKVRKQLEQTDQGLGAYDHGWMVPKDFPLMREAPTIVGRFYVQVQALQGAATTRYYVGSSVRAPGCEREEFWALDHEPTGLKLRRLST